MLPARSTAATAMVEVAPSGGIVNVNEVAAVVLSVPSWSMAYERAPGTSLQVMSVVDAAERQGVMKVESAHPAAAMVGASGGVVSMMTTRLSVEVASVVGSYAPAMSAISPSVRVRSIDHTPSSSEVVVATVVSDESVGPQMTVTVVVGVVVPEAVMDEVEKIWLSFGKIIESRCGASGGRVSVGGLSGGGSCFGSPPPPKPGEMMSEGGEGGVGVG